MLKYFYYLLILLSASQFFACNPDRFSISGTIDSPLYDGQKVILVTQNGEIADTTIIKGNRFNFSGKTDYPVSSAVIIGEDAFSFVITNDKINISLTSDNIRSGYAEYKHSKAYDNINKYHSENRTMFYEPYKNLLAPYPEEHKDSIETVKREFVFSYLDYLTGQFEDSRQREGLSIILSDLTGLFGTREQPDRLKELYELVPESEKTGYYDKRIKEFFERAESISPGQFINFGFTDINGKAGSVSDYKGKFVLLEYWATWCGPCRAKFPLLEQIATHDSTIQVIMISIDEDIARWEQMASGLGNLGVNIHYMQETDLKSKFFISSVPYNFLLSEDGKILKKNADLYEILELIEQSK